MAIYRIKKRTTPFVQIEKAAVEDRRLSWKAKGILVYLLSKPDHFIFHLDELAEHSTDGIDSLRSGLKELQQFGYVNRYPIKEKGRIVSWGLDVYESPKTPVVEPSSPHGDFPLMEKPLMENPTLLIKNISNNDLSNNKTYLTLTSDDHLFIQIYLKHFEKLMKKKHPRVSTANYVFIKNQIEHLISFDIDKKEWEKQAVYHLNHLPKNNNGSILPFLKASHRYFEVGVYDQF